MGYPSRNCADLLIRCWDDLITVHIHLDLVGGIAGDMFVAAMLDCFTEHIADMDHLMFKSGFRDVVTLDMEPANDGVLTGTRFKVRAAAEASGHGHRHYRDISGIISSSDLDRGTKAHALGIFRLLAEAESQVHGIEVEDVAFHEVGAWDSIADIVCAAHLIEVSGASSWSVSKLPMGRGQVKTEHGLLPVPAPATSLLLEGFDFFDDGIEGERITPTGAAILKYLQPSRGLPDSPFRLHRSGFGMGSKQFKGISNVLRALVFTQADTPVWHGERVLQLEFEIDDQTPEDLALALDRIRDCDGVWDVLQVPAFGKKGRQVAAIRILAQPEVESMLLQKCFDETTTLGVRREVVSRSVLSRKESLVEYDDGRYRVKLTERPGGPTAKWEMNDVVGLDADHVQRKALRERVEQAALNGKDGGKDDDQT